MREERVKSTFMEIIAANIYNILQPTADCLDTTGQGEPFKKFLLCCRD